jgi:hypothetical protein
MEIEIKTLKRKLTSSVLSQIAEASAKDLTYSLLTGSILGYINPPGLNKHRVFLIKNEEGDYRVCTNYPWHISKAEPNKIYAKSFKNMMLSKTFSSEHAAIDFLENFAKVKAVALLNHIYI